MRSRDRRRRTAVMLSLLICFSISGHSLQVACQTPVASPYAGAQALGRDAVRRMMDQNSVPGVGVAVAVEGDLVWSEGFGFADLERRVPVSAETKFGIGSITKALTTALFGRLMEQGLVDLDAPVENYLAEFPYKNQKISVRLIAGHLSGLDDTVNTVQLYTTTTHFDTTADALKLVLKEPLKYRPLERHFYTTGPYTIIAGVMEKAARKDFLTLMKEILIEPLGMKNTVPNDRRAIIPQRTSFYEREGGRSVNARYFDPSFKWAGAGYLSTAEDMARFGSALLNQGFLKQATLDELFRPLKTSAGEETEFALGWRVGTDKKNRRFMYQPGGGIGISGLLVLYPKEKLVVVILSNQTGVPISENASEVIVNSFIEQSTKSTRAARP